MVDDIASYLGLDLAVTTVAFLLVVLTESTRGWMGGLGRVSERWGSYWHEGLGIGAL